MPRLSLVYTKKKNMRILSTSHSTIKHALLTCEFYFVVSLLSKIANSLQIEIFLSQSLPTKTLDMHFNISACCIPVIYFVRLNLSNKIWSLRFNKPCSEGTPTILHLNFFIFSFHFRSQRFSDFSWKKRSANIYFDKIRAEQKSRTLEAVFNRLLLEYACFFKFGPQKYRT